MRLEQKAIQSPGVIFDLPREECLICFGIWTTPIDAQWVILAMCPEFAPWLGDHTWIEPRFLLG